MTVSNTSSTPTTNNSTTSVAQSTSTVNHSTTTNSETILKGGNADTTNTKTTTQSQNNTNEELKNGDGDPRSLEYASTSSSSSSSSDIGEGESSVEEFPPSNIEEEELTANHNNDSNPSQTSYVEREAPRLDLNTVKLFVGQIPYSYTEENLYPLFTQFGQVAEIVVIRDRFTQKSRGCAFVSFRDKEGADLCIKELNQRFKLPPLNTPMRVKYAFTEQQYESFSAESENSPSGNDSSSTSNEGVIAHSSTFLSTLNEKFDFGQPHPENKLFIRNIPKSVTEEELSQVFEPFGEIQDTVVLRTTIHTSKGCGFVKFVHAESAQRCVDAFRNEIIQPLQEKIWSQFKDTATESTTTTTTATTATPTAPNNNNNNGESSQAQPSSPPQSQQAQPRVLSQEQISMVDSIFKKSSFLIEGAITPLVVRYADDDTKLQPTQNESYTNSTTRSSATRKSSYSSQYQGTPSSSNAYYSQYGGSGGQHRQRRHSTPSHYRFSNPYLQYQRGVATGYYYVPQISTGSGIGGVATAWGYGDPSTFYGYHTGGTNSQSNSNTGGSSNAAGEETVQFYYTPASPGAMYGHPASAATYANGGGGAPLLYSQVASQQASSTNGTATSGGSGNSSSSSVVYHGTSSGSNEENGRSISQQQPQQPLMYYYYYYPPSQNPYKYDGVINNNSVGETPQGGVYAYPQVNRSGYYPQQQQQHSYPVYASSGYSKKRQNQKSNRMEHNKGASPQNNTTNYKLFEENGNHSNQKKQTSNSDA